MGHERLLHIRCRLGACGDCCAFACAWLHILVGYDPSLEFTYSDAKSAKKLLKSSGGVEAIVADVCGRNHWPEQPVIQAQRGDIVMMDTPQGAALGICMGSRAAFPGLDGLVFKPLLESRRSWRIN